MIFEKGVRIRAAASAMSGDIGGIALSTPVMAIAMSAGWEGPKSRWCERIWRGDHADRANWACMSGEVSRGDGKAKRDVEEDGARMTGSG
jgi:hypothetical protein